MPNAAQQQTDVAKIGVGEKLGYGVADLACGIYLNFFAFFLLYFYVDLGGVAAGAIGLMLLVTKLIDAITDPIMGAIADRTRTRWGRYRPYLLVGAVPMALTGASVFAVPDISIGGKLLWAYLSYTLAMLSYTVVNVPYTGLLGSISPSAAERTSVTAYRMFFSALSGITLGLLGTTLVRIMGDGDEARGIFLTMSCIGALAIFCVLTAFASTKERIPPTPSKGSVKQDLAVLVRTAPWIVVAIATVLGVLAISARAGSALFWFKYVAGDDATPVFLVFDRVALFFTALAAGQVTGVVTGNLLQRRFEKRDIIVSGGALKIAGIALFYVMPLDAVWPQTLAQLLVGTGFGFLMVMAFSMFTDIAEYVDWKSGLQMTGLVVSASTFAIKAGVAFGSAVPGFTLEATGFVAGESQNPAALLGIEIAFSAVPVAALLLAMLALLRYNLDRKTIATLEAELADRRAAIS